MSTDMKLYFSHDPQIGLPEGTIEQDEGGSFYLKKNVGPNLQGCAVLQNVSDFELLACETDGAREAFVYAGGTSGGERKIWFDIGLKVGSDYTRNKTLEFVDAAGGDSYEAKTPNNRGQKLFYDSVRDVFVYPARKQVSGVYQLALLKVDVDGDTVTEEIPLFSGNPIPVGNDESWAPHEIIVKGGVPYYIRWDGNGGVGGSDTDFYVINLNTLVAVKHTYDATHVKQPTALAQLPNGDVLVHGLDRDTNQCGVTSFDPAGLTNGSSYLVDVSAVTSGDIIWAGTQAPIVLLDAHANKYLFGIGDGEKTGSQAKNRNYWFVVADYTTGTVADSALGYDDFKIASDGPQRPSFDPVITKIDGSTALTVGSAEGPLPADGNTSRTEKLVFNGTTLTLSTPVGGELPSGTPFGVKNIISVYNAAENYIATCHGKGPVGGFFRQPHLIWGSGVDEAKPRTDLTVASDFSEQVIGGLAMNHLFSGMYIPAPGHGKGADQGPKNISLLVQNFVGDEFGGSVPSRNFHINLHDPSQPGINEGRWFIEGSIQVVADSPPAMAASCVLDEPGTLLMLTTQAPDPCGPFGCDEY